MSVSKAPMKQTIGTDTSIGWIGCFAICAVGGILSSRVVTTRLVWLIFQANRLGIQGFLSARSILVAAKNGPDRISVRGRQARTAGSREAWSRRRYSSNHRHAVI